MDDKACEAFFAQPRQTFQRQYEALRAIFADGRSQKEVAEQFGFTYGTMRQLVCKFREACDDHERPTQSLFFEPSSANLAPRTTSRSARRRWPTGGN